MSTNAAAQVCETSCPMYLTATTTVTDYWNDSCSVAELDYAIRRGAVGATTNPESAAGPPDP